MGKQKPNTLHTEGKIFRCNLCSKVPFGSEYETSSIIKHLLDSFSFFIMLFIEVSLKHLVPRMVKEADPNDRIAWLDHSLVEWK